MKKAQKKCLNSLWSNAILMAGVLAPVVIIWFGFSVQSRIEKIDKVWMNYNAGTLHAAAILSKLKSDFGHSGFVYNYEKYVHGKNNQYYALAKKGIESAYASIEDLESRDITLEQVYALVLLKQVANEYSDSIENVKLKRSSKSMSKKIGAQYTEAHHLADRALAILDKRKFRYYDSEMKRNVKAHLSETRQLISRGVWIIPLLFLIVLAMIYWLRRSLQIFSTLTQVRSFSDDIVEFSPDALVIVDDTGFIVKVNKQATSFFGYSRKELEGMSVERLIPAKYRKSHISLRQSSFKASAARPKGGGLELCAETNSGEQVPVELSLAFTVVDGKKFGLVSIRDISERKRHEAELKYKSCMLDSAQEISNIGSWDLDVKSSRFSWSNEVYRIFGLDKNKASASYQSFIDAAHKEDRGLLTSFIVEMISSENCHLIEYRVVRPNGNVRIIEQKSEVRRNSDGNVVTVLGTINDVTVQRSVEARLKLGKVVFDRSLESMLVLGSRAEIVDTNEAFCTMTGYDRDELMHTLPSMLALDRYVSDFYVDVWSKIKNKDNWQGEMWVRRKDGVSSPCLAAFSKVSNDSAHEVRYFMTLLDITAMKHDQEQLEQLAHFDQLTGLANRFIFGDRLLSAIARAHRADQIFAVAYVDLDGFKAVNDILGHEAGDDVLRKVAKRLQACVREDDTVARFGGDEFVVLLHDQSDMEQIAITVDRIVVALQMELESDNERLTVSASAGVALYPHDGKSSEDLVRNADQAMYRAKRAGKNRVCFFDPDAVIDVDSTVKQLKKIS